ncbi:MAG: prepilin-type N-terminal cleavage/methylation domain-containing protein [Desulfobacterales bacterium]|nr:prepilin-type N-terminal cleavage/methylation domain-containing protein [Desulfobacterales bacterium]
MWTQKGIFSNQKCNGFTLVELMIAMAISGIVLTAISTTYVYQQRHYSAQLDVTAMQQNIRAALHLLTRDIRMAGFEEYGSGEAKIVNAEPDLLSFTVDLNEDGDVDDAGERIAYDLYKLTATGPMTLGRTVSADNTTTDIPITTDAGTGRKVATGHQQAIENIEQLEFFYLDQDGVLTTVESQVRTVVISVLARADNPDRNVTNNQTYTPASQLAEYGGTPGAAYGVTPAEGWVVNDNFRRRMQIMRVECRNVGI